MMSRKRSGGSFGGKGVETVTTVYQQSENTGLESGKEDGEVSDICNQVKMEEKERVRLNKFLKRLREGASRAN